MDLQKIVILCVIAVIIIGGGWFLLKDDDEEEREMTTESMNEEQETTSLNTEETDTDDILSGLGSIGDLLAMGRSLRCEYTFSDDSASTGGSGVGYFDRDRMRIDSEIIEDGKTFTSHIINDSTNLYSWTESSEGSFAFVTPVNDNAPGGADFNETNAPYENGAVDTLDERVAYDCDPWGVDERMFQPPSDVDFVDMGAMMEDMMQNMPEGMPENMNEEMERLMESMPVSQ